MEVGLEWPEMGERGGWNLVRELIARLVEQISGAGLVGDGEGRGGLRTALLRRPSGVYVWCCCRRRKEVNAGELSR